MKVSKPANAKSAYNFFTSLMHEEFKLMHPGKSVDFIDFQKKCAAKWKGLSATEKKPFEEMAVLDKQRYQEGESIFYIDICHALSVASYGFLISLLSPCPFDVFSMQSKL